MEFSCIFLNDRVWLTLPQEHLVECSLVIFTSPSTFSCLDQPSQKLPINHLDRDGLEETTIWWALVAQRIYSSTYGLISSLIKNLVLTMSSLIGQP